MIINCDQNLYSVKRQISLKTLKGRKDGDHKVVFISYYMALWAVVISLVLHSNTVLIDTSTLLRIQVQVQPKTDCLKPEVCVLTIHDCIIHEQKHYVPTFFARNGTLSPFSVFLSETNKTSSSSA